MYTTQLAMDIFSGYGYMFYVEPPVFVIQLTLELAFCISLILVIWIA